MTIHARRASRQIDRSERRGGGRSTGGWVSALRLKLPEEATRLHLDRPEEGYLDTKHDIKFPWKKFRRHYVKGANNGRGCYINCGDQCLVCAYQNPKAFGFDIEPDEFLKDNRSSACFVVSGWVEEWYHLAPGVNKNSGKEFVERVRCTGRGCEHCRSKTEKVFGNRFHLVFSQATWEIAVDPMHEQIERVCKICDGFMYIPEYACSECNHTVVDLVTCDACDEHGVDHQVELDADKHEAQCDQCESKWSLLESKDSELSKLVNNKQKCSECGVSGYPIPNLVCSTDECKGESYDLYDAQLTLRKTGTGAQTKVHVDGFEIAKPDPRLFDANYQGDDSEVAQRVADRHQESLDLDAIYAPDTPSHQSELLGKPNLFAGEGSNGEREHTRWRSRE